ncbi:hypothetical protein PG990_011061 [Apiospora arundinis]
MLALRSSLYSHDEVMACSERRWKSSYSMPSEPKSDLCTAEDPMLQSYGKLIKKIRAARQPRSPSCDNASEASATSEECTVAWGIARGILSSRLRRRQR